MGPLACVASVSVRFTFSDSRSISYAAKTFRFLRNPVIRSFFAPNPKGNACYAGYGPFAEYGHVEQKNTLLSGMANDAEGQGKTKRHHSKSSYHFFQGPSASFAIRQGVFCIMWPYSVMRGCPVSVEHLSENFKLNACKLENYDNFFNSQLTRASWWFFNQYYSWLLSKQATD